MKIFKSLLILTSLLLISCSHKTAIKKRPGYEATGKDIMIATQGKFSTSAGMKMIELGGNAFDAALAVSFVISVERPQSTGIGGGGFMLYHQKGMKTPMALDFRESAPLKGHSKMFLKKNGDEIKNISKDGILAGGVPGLVAGLMVIHKKFGTLPLETILEPSITLAEKGFKVYPHLAKALKAKSKLLESFPASKKIFFGKDGKALKEGDLLIQKDLGKTLRAIAKKGKAGFYKGFVAKAIVKEQRKRGGLITHRDLRGYKVKTRNPVYGKYKGYEVYSMSPPSSGGTHVIEIMNIIENDNLKNHGHLSAQSIHLTSAAMQQAFADRAAYLGDADFVKVPVKGLISKAYAMNIRKGIKLSKAKRRPETSKGNPFPYESDETTHFTVMDGKGNVITSTQTINGWFGSGLVIPGTGIVLNNEMDDFATKPGAKNLYGAIGGENNLVAPRKRPLSSMSPTIIFKDNSPLLALGTPSGTRILTCVAGTVLNYLEYGLPLYESVAALRFHHQWAPDEIRVEEPGFNSDVEKELKSFGYNIRKQNLGCRVQAISYKNGILRGVSDPRGEGSAKGF